MTILPFKQLNKDKKDQEILSTSVQNHISTTSSIYIPTHISTSDSIYIRRRPLQNNHPDVNPSTSLEINKTSDIDLQFKRKNKVVHPSRKNKLQSIKHSHKTETCDEEINSGDEYDEGDNKDQSSDEFYTQFEKNLEDQRGFKIKKMTEDGACLFRAVADQVYGDPEKHDVVRKLCMDYMAKNADYYSQFVTENFEKYIERKRHTNSHGNHLEIQAMAEIFNRPMEVYKQQLQPINIFHGYQETSNIPIRLSYFKNMHYDSIIDPFKASIGIGLGLPACFNGVQNQTQLAEIIKSHESSEIEETMLKDKLAASDIEATSQLIEEQVARESYLQWLKDSGQYTKSMPSSAGFSKELLPSCFNPSSKNSSKKNLNQSLNNAFTNNPNIQKRHLLANDISALDKCNDTKINSLQFSCPNDANNKDNFKKCNNLLTSSTVPFLSIDDHTSKLSDRGVSEPLLIKSEESSQSESSNEIIVEITDTSQLPSTSFDSSSNSSLLQQTGVEQELHLPLDESEETCIIHDDNSTIKVTDTEQGQISFTKSPKPLKTPSTSLENKADSNKPEILTDYSLDIFGLADSDFADQEMIQALIISQQEYYEKQYNNNNKNS